MNQGRKAQPHNKHTRTSTHKTYKYTLLDIENPAHTPTSTMKNHSYLNIEKELVWLGLVVKLSLSWRVINKEKGYSIHTVSRCIYRAAVTHSPVPLTLCTRS